MRTLKIPFPNISKYEKTRLMAPPGTVETKFPAGSLTLYLRNVAGFNNGDYMILDPFESEEAEIVRIDVVDRAAHAVDLVDPTYNDHAVGVVAMKTPYNQTKIYKGATSDVTTHSILDTVELRPDNAYTYYNHEAGTSADYYSYTYYNSGRIPPYETSPRTLYADSLYDCVTNVNDLKQNFMFGLDLSDDSGFPFPNSMFEFAIRSAVDSLEKVLGVKLKPTVIVEERQDYWLTDYREYAFLQLNEYPILSVEKVMIRYPSTPDVTGASTVDIPSSWVQVNKQHGQINLVPTYGSFSNMIVGMGGDYLSFLWRGWMGNAGYFPNLWAINYTAGVGECGAVPYDVIAVVSKMAAFYPLNIAGDLVGGIAIASKSIGIDGLSQSINTTSSPENAGYCVMKSYIYTDGGKVRIEDLVGKTPNVHSVFRKNGKLVRGIANASKVWKTREAPVWKLEFDGGATLLATKEHPIMLPTGKYVPVENLTESMPVKGDDGVRTVRRVVPNFTSGPVLDMTVPMCHNFIANGVVIHNSARLRQYERELKVEIPRLVGFYKGLRMSVA